MSKDKLEYWRPLFVYFVMLLFAISIAYNVFYINLKEGPYLRDMANSFLTKYDSVAAVRGNIYTLEGKLLATSIPVYDIRIDFCSKTFKDENKNKKKFKSEVDSLSRELSKLFKNNKDYKKVINNCIKTNNRYCSLATNVSGKELNQLKKFPIFKRGTFKGGFIVEEKSKRVYPFNILAKRSIGKAYLNCVDCNNVGLEGAYDKYLQGAHGRRFMQKTVGNNWKPVNDANEIEPKNGMDVITTIDINLQDVAENALKRQLRKSDAAYGCVVLMEVETGYIKAIANLKRGWKDTANYFESYNFAIGESSEPGSTFKLASVVVALEDGYVDLDSKLNTGRRDFFGKEMKDSHYEGKNEQKTLKEAFAISSNVAISELIHNNYSKNPDKFINGLNKLGLNDLLNIDIKGEGAPYIKNTKDKHWSMLSLPWMSIGYELNITPLQLLTFYNGIANNGKLMKPLFVKEIRNMGNTIETFEPYILKEAICSEKTINKVKELLQEVVEKGTAKNIKNDIYKISGKTGTAQIANNNKGYRTGSQVSYRASFVGYFPSDNPKYSCVVVINNPARAFYGSAVAAPVFKEIADRVYATRLDIHDGIKNLENDILAVPKFKKGSYDELKNITEGLLNNPNLTNKVCKTNVVNEQYLISNLSKKLVPDLSGMSIKDAAYYLENYGLKVIAIGKGSIVKQSLDAGTRFNKGSSIILYLA